ncbi:transglycosylase SLT domain-containing protein [Streptomyces rapamycinicus]|uniref:Lytic transglycosylase n=2 Tax=Streptomyces rapamycinicus TaxID=1226757 RepID=A0A0A0NRF5_STRRN|nr:transglycosylase SLT domain-containing protein [Streptomyces rapamycinicus]AGP58858.1 lytic transglycosylase [Streptomyces rapamycinicus NRRL 5491]MBB4786579.1 membrane protein involved in colicin uptake [Streptomyces rapamycinicus]RLV77962.1 lytic transglycosylase [Streptomyces rapamycinicus NRRL 5491]UTO66660.1 transglycosylase SLT domain-containing protein [Streptomyces rapamycinicus]UTP34613.1 transglycosylase SLT domain-containing protein [Streptomyces rapamycinicus NRRL 5491]
MPLPNIPGYSRLNKTHKYSAAGIAAAGAAAIAFAVVPGGDAGAKTTAQDLPNKPVALTSQKADAQAHHEALAKQSALAAKQAKDEAAKKAAKKAAADAAAKKAAEEAAAKKAAEAKAAKERAAKQAASRSATRIETVAAEKKTYPDNLDGWIRESLDIMKKKGIPGSYEGIHRNIIRESGGNPRAINNWDINAQNGVPSKGLLQVIAPTFQAYHVEGTAWDAYDPVANITAACNYAADRYGSMDNVNGPY